MSNFIWMQRTRTIGVLTAALMITLGSCGGVKSKMITEKNKDTIFEEIKTSRDLTIEEVRLLEGYVVRTALQNISAGKTPALPVGKTIGQVIEEQRAVMDQAAVASRAESLRVIKAREAEAQQQAILREAVTVSAFGKELVPKEYGSMMACKLIIENHSKKDIRAFQGTLVFRDLFGDQIIRLLLKEDDTLAGGASRRGARYWDYNQFRSEDVRWAGTKFENMKIAWEPETVLFTDGTTLQAGSQ